MRPDSGFYPEGRYELDGDKLFELLQCYETCEKSVGKMESGKVAGVGTDVFASEPVLPENPLFAFEQYVATPYTSVETYESCATTSIATAEALIAVFEGNEPFRSQVHPVLCLLDPLA